MIPFALVCASIAFIRAWLSLVDEDLRRIDRIILYHRSKLIKHEEYMKTLRKEPIRRFKDYYVSYN